MRLLRLLEAPGSSNSGLGDLQTIPRSDCMIVVVTFEDELRAYRHERQGTDAQRKTQVSRARQSERADWQERNAKLRQLGAEIAQYALSRGYRARRLSAEHTPGRMHGTTFTIGPRGWGDSRIGVGRDGVFYACWNRAAKKRRWLPLIEEAFRESPPTYYPWVNCKWRPGDKDLYLNDWGVYLDNERRPAVFQWDLNDESNTVTSAPVAKYFARIIEGR